MRPRRLLILVNDAAFFVSHRLVLAVEAQRAGYDVHVATGPGAASATITAAGLQHHVLPISRSGSNPVTELRALAAIAALYRRLRPDIVHLVTIKPVLYGGLLARQMRVPRVVAAISGFGFVFLSRGWRASVRRRLVIALYRRALRHRRIAMIFQNPQDRADMLRHVGLDAANTVLIAGSGVDVRLFGPPTRDPAVPVVVMAARLLVDKGVREFLEAAMRLQKRGINARFQLAGTTDPGNPASMSDAEIARCRESGVVEVLGHVGDIPALFSKADVVVLPSYREGLPKVLAEAAAAGAAVVTTDVPGCRDATVPGVTGLLVPSGDAAALADAIASLVIDRARCARMGEAGRELAQQRFSLDHVIAEHLRVYESLFVSA